MGTKQAVSGLTICTFYADDIYTVNTRSVQNLSFAFSIIGGFLGIVMTLGNFLIGWLQEHLFYSGLIADIYKCKDFNST